MFKTELHKIENSEDFLGKRLQPLLKNGLSVIDNVLKPLPDWISNRISSKTMKPFDTNLEPTMSNLANLRVILKLKNLFLVQKNSSSLHSNFILNLYIAFESNSWSLNPTNNFTLKIVYLVQSN